MAKPKFLSKGFVCSVGDEIILNERLGFTMLALDGRTLGYVCEEHGNQLKVEESQENGHHLTFKFEGRLIAEDHA